MGYRYIVKYNNMKFTHYILDTKTGEKLGYREMCEILNQQDKRIKELEKELKRKTKTTTKELAIELLEKMKNCLAEMKSMDESEGWIVNCSVDNKNQRIKGNKNVNKNI